MRIISGLYKHRKLQVPNKGVRPTTDFVREAVFNILGDFVYKSNILDLFGGSGALTIEGISRGADSGIIIDKNSLAIKTIKNNIKILNIENIKVIKGDSRAVLRTMSQNEENIKKFNLVFIDPPYKEVQLYKELLEILDKYNLLSEEALVVCEADSKNKFEKFENFETIKDRKYGNSKIIILRYLK